MSHKKIQWSKLHALNPDSPRPRIFHMQPSRSCNGHSTGPGRDLPENRKPGNARTWRELLQLYRAQKDSQNSLHAEGHSIFRAMQGSQPVRQTILISALSLSLLFASACSEPDGLKPEEVSRRFVEAVAKPDAAEARKYVTFSSKLLVTVVIELFAMAENSSRQQGSETAELREELKLLASDIRCTEEKEGMETVYCTFAADDSVAFPLVKTDDGWRLDLVQLLEEQKGKNSPEPTTADPMPHSN